MRDWARTWENNRFEMLGFAEHGDADGRVLRS
jgi:hypothetical protein